MGHVASAIHDHCSVLTGYGNTQQCDAKIYPQRARGTEIIERVGA
jgi:hypothetical protein